MRTSSHTLLYPPCLQGAKDMYKSRLNLLSEGFNGRNGENAASCKIGFSYSKARNRYGSPSLKEVNMFDHVREE